MEVKSYFVPSPNFIPKGEYKETELDRQRKQADIVLESIDGGYYSLRIQNPKVVFSGKRVKRYSNGVVAVNKALWEKLTKLYTYVTNF